MKDVHLLDLIHGISNTLDYVSTAVTGHHRRVGIACGAMADTLGFDADDTADLLIAGMMHDVGAFALELKLDGLDFEADLTAHSIVGYNLLYGHELLEHPAEVIRYHHTPWKTLVASDIHETTATLANIVNLADRVDILNKVGTKTFDRDRIRAVIGVNNKDVYSPQIIEAFMDASATDEFWQNLDNTTSPVRELVRSDIRNQTIPREQLIKFSRFFSHIIDFRSRHTATHSQGVAETAVQIARLAGMDENDLLKMRLAGNLHDIGKLAVPISLLDKPAALDDDEFDTIKGHAAICDTLLHSVPGMEEIADWACEHHGRINGEGYPKGLRGDELSLGSRILAVADVCTALSEDRPYRIGMGKEKTCATLAAMARDGHLDEELVNLTIDNYNRIDALRRIVQSRAMAEFKQFNEDLTT